MAARMLLENRAGPVQPLALERDLSGIFTQEIAEAFGYRDRCLGIDAESRNMTLDRFQGKSGRPLKRLHRAYWRGFGEADDYINFMAGGRVHRVILVGPNLIRVPALRAAE